MKKTDIILAAVLAALLAASALYLALQPREGTAAEIYLNGELYAEIDLTSVKESYTLEVGEGNTVLIERGGISMLEADCPDKLCIRQGKSTSSAKQIVCLPNRVMIIVTGSGQKDIDVITGGAAE